MGRWIGALLFCVACTLIGDTGDKLYVVHDTTSTGMDPCPGGCQGTVAACGGPACIDGACDILFSPTGTACTGEPGYCDGAGFCVACTQKSHCPPELECIYGACFAGTCGDRQ